MLRSRFREEVFDLPYKALQNAEQGREAVEEPIQRFRAEYTQLKSCEYDWISRLT